VKESERLLAVRRVRASRGIAWTTEAFRLFLRAPFVWVLLSGAVVLVMVLIAAAPLGIGSAIVQTLSPAVLAGFMVGCRSLEQGEEMELAHLGAGIRQAAPPLIGVGLVYLAGNILAGTAMHAVGGDAIAHLAELAETQHPDSAEVERALDGALPAIAIGLAILVPFAMATWFAPALVLFDSMGLVDALRVSVRACLVNIWPLSVFCLWTTLLLVVALVPYGMGLIVFVPVVVASFYTAYRDIFRPADPVPIST
jgi:uncharacterized membrane protein